jgi:hypothetical protein
LTGGFLLEHDVARGLLRHAQRVGSARAALVRERDHVLAVGGHEPVGEVEVARELGPGERGMARELDAPVRGQDAHVRRHARGVPGERVAARGEHLDLELRPRARAHAPVVDLAGNRECAEPVRPERQHGRTLRSRVAGRLAQRRRARDGEPLEARVAPGGRERHERGVHEPVLVGVEELLVDERPALSA